MPSGFLTKEQLYQQTLRDITNYVRYCYSSPGDEQSGELTNTLQDFDDLYTLPFSRDNYRVALQAGATLMVNHDLSMGASDKERAHIFAALADLGFFVEADIVHADFVL